mgnify:CR=1 FL=1
MKIFAILVVCAFTLTACPQKKVEEEGSGVERAEGTSSTDKSGEGSSDEMKEKKGGSDSAPAESSGGEEKK